MADDSPPELPEGLLDFAPVPRKCERHNGWTAERQRKFIAALAAMRDPTAAALSVGMSGRGAYQLRKEAGAEEFGEAWDKALALYEARHPPPAQNAAEAAGAEEDWDDIPAGEAPPELLREMNEIFKRILEKYLRKLNKERTTRLEGRIVEADFYVRQLTWIEILLDFGGQAHKLREHFSRGELPVTHIVATPMSLLLDKARRAYWLEKEEVDRPTLPELGLHNERLSVGAKDYYMAGRDGDEAKWHERRGKEAVAAAEAQRLWEEKARVDAEAWRQRLEGEASPLPEGAGGGPRPRHGPSPAGQGAGGGEAGSSQAPPESGEAE